MTRPTDFFHDANPFIMDGQVISTADPDEMGRVKVWVQALDGENFNAEKLPWAEYFSPFMGFTVAYPGGDGTVKNDSHSAYGLWAIPKVGATVAVFCLNGDPSSRCYFASAVRLHRNRSLPAGRNFDGTNPGPFGDATNEKGELLPIEPAYSNLREQFQNNVNAPEAKSRGVYERQAAQAQTDKNDSEGYSKSPVDSYLDPQTYCIVTPGRHAVIMQDDPRGSRMRFKSGKGHQIIFDDANERMYMSTAKGKTWVELDEDGHFHAFSAESMSFRSGADINFFADGNVNIEAGRGVNVKANKADIRLSTASALQVTATTNILMSACGTLDLNSESSIKITADANFDLFASGSLSSTSVGTFNVKAGGKLIQTGQEIHLNGQDAKTADKASCATKAEGPSIVPGHEPWPRPTSKKKRNPNWKA